VVTSPLLLRPEQRAKQSWQARPPLLSASIVGQLFTGLPISHSNVRAQPLARAVAVRSQPLADGRPSYTTRAATDGGGGQPVASATIAPSELDEGIALPESGAAEARRRGSGKRARASDETRQILAPSHEALAARPPASAAQPAGRPPAAPWCVGISMPASRDPSDGCHSAAGLASSNGRFAGVVTASTCFRRPTVPCESLMAWLRRRPTCPRHVGHGAAGGRGLSSRRGSASRGCRGCRGAAVARGAAAALAAAGATGAAASAGTDLGVEPAGAARAGRLRERPGACRQAGRLDVL
jgi:hypothetical protein